MKRFIIGLTGSLGSGCSTTSKYLEEKLKYKRISISNNILKPLAKKYGINFETTQNKQDAGNNIRKKYRDEYRIEFLNEIKKYKPEDRIVVECFRNPIEIDFLRDEFPHFYLIALYAPKTERKVRKEKQNENNFDNIDNRDEGEQEKLGQQVSKCVNYADIILDNSHHWQHMDDAKNFLKKIDYHIDLLETPFRSPNEEEMMMHLAYSVSLYSTCIRRQVGAVITDENYRVLSTGYNDVPRNSNSCFNVYSQCYRKIKRKEGILQLCKEIKYCTFCGNEFQFDQKFFTCDPRNLPEEILTCNKCKNNLLEVIPIRKELDFCRSLHAEENAILSNPYLSDAIYKKNKNMIIFTTTFPCMLCAKKIANSGIKKIIFVEPYPIFESYQIFKENNVEVKTFEGIKSLSFNWIFRKRAKYIKDYANSRLKELNKLCFEEGK